MSPTFVKCVTNKHKVLFYYFHRKVSVYNIYQPHSINLGLIENCSPKNSVFTFTIYKKPDLSPSLLCGLRLGPDEPYFKQYLYFVTIIPNRTRLVHEGKTMMAQKSMRKM